MKDRIARGITGAKEFAAKYKAEIVLASATALALLRLLNPDTAAAADPFRDWTITRISPSTLYMAGPSSTDLHGYLPLGHRIKDDCQDLAYSNGGSARICGVEPGGYVLISTKGIEATVQK